MAASTWVATIRLRNGLSEKISVRAETIYNAKALILQLYGSDVVIFSGPQREPDPDSGSGFSFGRAAGGRARYDEEEEPAEDEKPAKSGISIGQMIFWLIVGYGAVCFYYWQK